MAPTVALSLQSQLYAPVLAVTSGVRGYRLAYVGGAHYDVLPDCDALTWGDATRLRTAGLEAVKLLAATLDRRAPA